MADYYLNLETWRMEVSGGKVREVTDGLEEMTQRIGIAIKTHRGEWVFDIARGLPWTEGILVRSPNLAQITSRARAYLLTVEGVTGVRKLRITLDAATREMRWTLDVETYAGVTGPFNVTVAL